MRKYTVVTKDQYGTRTTVEHTADDVQISPQGHAKFLNGRGRDAVLVAFYNVEDVISISNEESK